MKITLCGSTKYQNDYRNVNLILSKAGHIVYSVAGYGHKDDILTAEEKEILDLVHLKKIIDSDLVVVVGEVSPGVPYIGASTKREIHWALLIGKGVVYQRELPFLTEKTNAGALMSVQEQFIMTIGGLQ